MIYYFIKALKSYATFNGRARRKEYWYFVLCHLLVAFTLQIVAIRVPAMNFFYIAWSLFLLVPAIAVGVRRMHDVGKSGWYLLIPVYSLVLACSAGQPGENAYGPDPKGDKEEWDFDKKTA